MSKNLIIVESPTKAKTIRKMAGSNYRVMASVGHVRDLPKSKLGIDVEDNYEPHYINIRGKGPLINDLKKAAKGANKILLATDPDREGEAISWHLSHILNLDPNEPIRIAFNEITKDTVKREIKNPRPIDMDLVDAQQARRVLDRLVGYKISPLLWKKIKSGLSAGRVQSVVLKMICDREDEIRKFVPQEYWTITANFKKSRKKFTGEYFGRLEGEKAVNVKLSNEEEAHEVLKSLDPEAFTVHSIKNSTRSRRAPAPFTTSTLQQEASKRINFNTRKTMSVAQSLYEGIRLDKEGNVGLITYMRTDSTRLAPPAIAAAKEFILDHYGEAYSAPNSYGKKKGNIQDAHEAIRPTDVFRTPLSIKEFLSRDEYRLYDLIWRRFVASQMKAAIFDTQRVDIVNGHSLFRTNGNKLNFDGFLRVLPAKDKDDILPELEEGELISATSVDPEQHFTQPPARYNEASLIKLLEEKGIGRPSTYAPIISTLRSRYYVALEEKRFVPTELGETVSHLLEEYFPTLMDSAFTAQMEESLDEIADGDLEWKKVVDDVYSELKDSLAVAEAEVEKIQIRDEPTDVICEKCGRNMVIKMGRYGKFLACPGFPECRNTKPLVEKIGVKCPKCHEGEIVVKRSKKGRKFFGCSRYPDCDFVSWNEPIEEHCPKCGDILTKKETKGKTQILCHNKECDFMEWRDPQNVPKGNEETKGGIL